MSDKLATDPTLPPDVYENSRSRVPMIERDEIMTDDGKAAYDSIINDPKSIVGLRGPAGIGLYSPGASALQRPLNTYLRFKTGLDRKICELVMIVAAREMDQPFEWVAHENAARQEGLPEEVIEIVRNRKPATGIDETYATVIALGREAITGHNVQPQTYATALRVFGKEDLVNISYLMGQYLNTAVMLHIFAQQLPPGVTSTLPVD